MDLNCIEPNYLANYKGAFVSYKKTSSIKMCIVYICYHEYRHYA